MKAADIVLIITAFMTPLSVMVLAWINIRASKVATVEQGKIHAVATETLAVATQVDHAVNGKAPGEASISQDVQTIKDKQEADSPSAPLGADGDAVLPMLKRLVADVAALTKRASTKEPK